jgi:hypothetical protein
MIWLRRAFTLPLILIFIVLIIAAVTVTAVNNTAANPDFYNDRMVQADMYNYIYDAVLPAALDEVDTGEASDSPVDIATLHNEIVAAAEQVFPPSWLRQQFESITNVLIPYMVDNEPGFTYTFTVKQQMDDVGQAIKDKILHSAAFTDMYNEFIVYMSENLYEDMGDVPTEAGITQHDVEVTLKLAVNQSWLVSQAENAMDEIIPYMIGDASQFTVYIPVQDVVTDELLLILLGPGNEEYLDEAREQISLGLVLTEEDVFGGLGEDIDDMRDLLSDKVVFTQADLLDAMFENPQDAEGFDDVRYWISTGRSLLWVLWVVPFLLLIGIGFLGGRGWKTRAAGPLVILFFVSLVMFLGVMLTWGQWGEAAMQDAMNPSDYQGVAAVMLEKADEVAVDAAGSFVSNMQDMYMYMMIASGVGLAGVGVWWMVGSRGKKNVA